MNNKDNVQKILKNLNIEKISEKYKKGTKSFTHISKNLTSNMIKNIQGKSTEIMNSIKNSKLKNLEQILKIDRSSKISSNKKSYIYQTSDKTIIIDLDMWGEPVSVTTKTATYAKVQTIKFLGETPYIYPNFSEKALFGNIINLEKDEIWYNDSGTIIILKFIGTEPNIIKVKLDIPREYNHNDLEKDAKLKVYLKNCSLIYRDKKLLNLLEYRKIQFDNIVTINKSIIIYKNSNKYIVLIINSDYKISNIFKLAKLPFTNESALKSLFSKEIVDYAESNKYNFEDFIYNNKFIEYWQFLGTKKVCLLKYEVNE
jgi:hypothetical protein